MELFDTHCHIDFDEFEADRNSVISAAIEQGVQHILVPSVSQRRWNKTIDVCQQYQACHLALGLHPVFIAEHQPQHLVELEQLINQHKPAAVGEIGLDFYQKDADKEKQLLFFEKQILIAQQYKLPIIVHNRKAHDQCISLIKEMNFTHGGIIHAFNGSIQQAQHYISLGFLLGFGGMLTFERSRKLQNLAKQIPLSAMVLETDAPDMTVEQHKGERNSPEYIPYVLQALSNIKSLPPSEIALNTTNNSKQLFRLNP